MRIVLFPGAFDPIHIGHINMASIASNKLDADVIFIPAVVSVWKKQSVEFKHKIEMVRLAIKDNPRFSVSNFEETTNQEKNYSVDTVRYFHNLYPNDELYFLIGEDQVRDFHLWKEADEIARLSHIAFLKRPGCIVDNDNISTYHMVELEGDLIDCSSSMIREMKGLEYLPKDLLYYIEDNRLYYMSKIREYINERRLSHSCSVARLAFDIALANKIERPIRAYIAGLLHDIGKDIPLEQSLTIMGELFKIYINLPRFSYHQFVGSYLARKVFGIDDKEIIDAIRFHATGKENMSQLGMIIYASDKIEPTRGFDSKDLIDSCLSNYYQGFVDVLRANREFLIAKKGEGSINNPLTAECFNQYLK